MYIIRSDSCVVFKIKAPKSHCSLCFNNKGCDCAPSPEPRTVRHTATAARFRRASGDRARTSAKFELVLSSQLDGTETLSEAKDASAAAFFLHSSFSSSECETVHPSQRVYCAMTLSSANQPAPHTHTHTHTHTTHTHTHTHTHPPPAALGSVSACLGWKRQPSSFEPDRLWRLLTLSKTTVFGAREIQPGQSRARSIVPIDEALPGGSGAQRGRRGWEKKRGRTEREKEARDVNEDKGGKMETKI
ncbi:hypothetical protein Q5P01_020952 [Channa striata]|uniref:Uncharacterized protein n=1 Tax=Channa striata TaxID=64152 RepID=A0AA88LYL3_CHASR|nr:hypothetical protein Q5P01_020952 [Channa striata]